MNKQGDGFRYNTFDRIKYHLLNKVFDYPYMEYKYRVAEIFEKERDIDLLITIAAPHEIHFGAALAKKRQSDSFPKCWIADCGDPFMFNPYSKPAPWFMKEEKRWCRQVDFITVPTEQSQDAYYPEFRDKIRIIPQGFNFNKTPVAKYTGNTVPTFAYTGVFYPGLRDPFKFLEYLSTLCLGGILSTPSSHSQRQSA